MGVKEGRAVTQTEKPAVLTVTETAKVLGIERNLAYRLVACGQIPALRLGRRWVVPAAALDKLLNDPGVPRKEVE
jgi:excisionase family DNA binding protein